MTNPASLRHYTRIYTAPLYADMRMEESLYARLKTEPFHVVAYLLRQEGIRQRLLGPDRPVIHSLARALPTSFTDSLETEFHWATAVLLANSESLNAFAQLRTQFESAILTANYTLARETLSRISVEYGDSYWSVESLLLLEEQQHGLSANRQQLADYYSSTTSKLFKLNATLLSERAETTLCPDEYDRTCAQLAAARDWDEIFAARVAASLRYRLNRPSFNMPQHLPFILHWEESHSLIDRYLAYTFAITQLIVTNTLFSNASVMADLRGATDRFRDRFFVSLGAMLGHTSLKHTPLNDAIYMALDKYTRGAYANAASLCADILAEDPTIFECYAMLAKSCSRLGKPLINRFADGSLATRILTALYSVCSRSPSLVQDLYSLRKLSYRLEGTSLGQRLHSFHIQTTEDTSPARNSLHNFLQSSLPTPRLAVCLGDSSSAASYLSALSDAYPGNAAIDFFRDVTCSPLRDLVSSASSVPFSRRLKYCASILEGQDNYIESLEYYERMQGAQTAEGMDEGAASVGKLRCLLQLKRVTDCVILLAQTAVRKPTVLSKVVLQKLFSEHSDSTQATLSTQIEWPVLKWLAHLEADITTSLEDMYGILDDFLTAHGAFKPTDLKPLAATFDYHSLVYLLRHVCIPEVLDSSPWFDGLSELEGERIAICEWLTDIDSVNSSMYASEIAGLRRLAAMREMSHKSRQSKIFVDTTQIAEHLPEPFVDRIKRCLAYSQQLSESLRQTLRHLGMTLSEVRKSKIVVIDASFGLFQSVFNDLNQQFIASNEWGLDSNLSQRIRHGTLAGELRPVFERRGLITQRDAAGVYIENSAWVSKSVAINSHNVDAVNDVFAELSQGVDDIIALVRNSWVQIKTSSKIDGFFDFEFSEEELHHIMLEVGKSDSPLSFTGRVFEVLWERTEQNLERLRYAITHKLTSLINNTLDESVNRLEELLGESSVAEFRDAVATTKTQAYHTIGRISEWFHVDHPEWMSDFNMQALVDALVDTVNQYWGASRLRCIRTVEAEQQFPGRLFRPLWDLLFILLDNCVRHSGKAVAEIRLHIRWNAGRLFVCVSNTLSEETDFDSLGLTAKQMSGHFDHFGDLAMLKREGGSGLFKLHKILRYDMACDDYTVLCRVADVELFEATISGTPR